VKKFGFLLVAVVMTAAILAPSAVYAGDGGKVSNAPKVQILTKTGTRGAVIARLHNEGRLPSNQGRLPSNQGHLPQNQGYFKKTTDGAATTGILGKPLTGERYAILVGISDYPGDAHVLAGGFDLSYADDDALLMYETLVGVYGFPAQNVALLQDTQATRTAILAQIAALQNVVDKNDEVVFYFSGHGVRYPGLGTPVEAHGSAGIAVWGNADYPVPGFDYIWEKELDQAFKKLDAKRQVFIFDCCVAGGMLKLGGNESLVLAATTPDGISIEFGEDYAALYDDPSMMVNHGLFTYFLAGLGMQYGMADFNGDGLVTVEEAFDLSRGTLAYMSQTMDGFCQLPVISDRFRNDLLP